MEHSGTWVLFFSSFLKPPVWFLFSSHFSLASSCCLVSHENFLNTHSWFSLDDSSVVSLTMYSPNCCFCALAIDSWITLDKTLLSSGHSLGLFPIFYYWGCLAFMNGACFTLLTITQGKLNSREYYLLFRETTT